MTTTKGGVEIGKQEAINDSTVTRPKDTKFYQQKIAAWQPLLTAAYASPLCLLVGAIFIPVGAVLFLATQSVQEASVDYTKCRDINGMYCAELVKMAGYFSTYRPCLCNVTLNLTQSMTGQVYVYYALTNFYQSHRRYAKSRDDFQLRGSRSADLLKDCNPYKQDELTGLWVAPCGAVANSMFNDSFRLIYEQPDGSELEVPWTKRGIAWDSDRDRKFGSGSNWNVSVKPTSWPVPAWLRSPSGYQGDEELIVWMRTAALPTFRKLHRLVDHAANGTPDVFVPGLPAGMYVLQVAYAFPVTGFAGTKSLVLTTSGWMGGRNPVLGAAYMAVGCLYTILGLVLALVQLQSRRSTVLSVHYPIGDVHSRSTSVSALVDNDPLSGTEKARLDMLEEDAEDPERQQQAEQVARPRNLLQALTLADY